MKNKSPRILIIDIETSPIISYTWGLFDQNVGLNQVIQDWNILSYAAKFIDEKKVHYNDLSKSKDIHNDKKLLQDLWKLLDEADVVIGQNSVAFDIKKIKARMLIHNMKPPSSFKQIDTMLLSKKHFNFTSNKLEYLSKTLCSTHKKLSHKKYAGFELWSECLKGNQSAWLEMKAYNIADVLSTEELYHKLQPWDSSINFNVYSDELEHTCACGSCNLKKNGYKYTSVGKYQRYVCLDCGSEAKDRTNLLSKDKRQSLKV
jgi:DNA polymerase elongation subunit (family B)